MAKCVFKVAVIAVFLKLMLSTKSALGAQYRVGGLKGWEYGNDFEAWASSITFKQGDTLYFEYDPNMHSVLEVSEQDYKTCNTRAPITSDGGKGHQLVTLEAGVTFFFICGLPAHCSDGHMKVAIPVLPAATAVNSTVNTTSAPPFPSSSSSAPPPASSPAAAAPRPQLLHSFPSLMLLSFLFYMLLF